MADLNTPACFSLTKIYHQNCSLETASSWWATALKIPLQKKHPEPHNGTQPRAAQNDGALCHFERPWFHPWQMGWHQRVREFLSFTSRQCELWLTGKSRSLSVMIFSSIFNHFYLIYCLLCIHVYTWWGGGVTCICVWRGQRSLLVSSITTHLVLRQGLSLNQELSNVARLDDQWILEIDPSPPPSAGTTGTRSHTHCCRCYHMGSSGSNLGLRGLQHEHL